MHNELLMNFIVIGTVAYVIGMTVALGTFVFLFLAISQIQERNGGKNRE